MNKSLLTFGLLTLVALSGCRSGTAGGPGAVDQNNQPMVGQADQTFKLLMPETVMRQGETKSVSITIERSLNFSEDVALAFAELPQGLSMDISNPVINRGDSEARITLTAAPDASLGDFSFQVTGTPTNGSNATNSFRVTITKE
jgi:hypothetical protein